MENGSYFSQARGGLYEYERWLAADSNPGTMAGCIAYQTIFQQHQLGGRVVTHDGQGVVTGNNSNYQHHLCEPSEQSTGLYEYGMGSRFHPILGTSAYQYAKVGQINNQNDCYSVHASSGGLCLPERGMGLLEGHVQGQTNGCSQMNGFFVPNVRDGQHGLRCVSQLQRPVHSLLFPGKPLENRWNKGLPDFFEKSLYPGIKSSDCSVDRDVDLQSPEQSDTPASLCNYRQAAATCWDNALAHNSLNSPAEFRLRQGQELWQNEANHRSQAFSSRQTAPSADIPQETALACQDNGNFDLLPWQYLVCMSISIICQLEVERFSWKHEIFLVNLLFVDVLAGIARFEAFLKSYCVVPVIKDNHNAGVNHIHLLL